MNLASGAAIVAAFILTPLAISAGWPFVLLLAAALTAVAIAQHVHPKGNRHE